MLWREFANSKSFWWTEKSHKSKSCFDSIQSKEVGRNYHHESCREDKFYDGRLATERVFRTHHYKRPNWCEHSRLRLHNAELIQYNQFSQTTRRVCVHPCAPSPMLSMNIFKLLYRLNEDLSISFHSQPTNNLSFFPVDTVVAIESTNIKKVNSLILFAGKVSATANANVTEAVESSYM